MTLRDFLDGVLAPEKRYCRKVVLGFHTDFNALDKHVGRTVALHDLTDDLLIGFREALEAAGLAPRTIGLRISNIRNVWRAAAVRGLVATRPTRRSYANANRTASPGVKRRIRRVAILLARGKTLKQACRSLNLAYSAVLSNKVRHPELFEFERDRAMKLLLQDVRWRAERLTIDANEQELFLADAARVDRWAQKHGEAAFGDEDGPDLLRHFVARYAANVDISPGTIEQYRFAVADLDRWHGRPVRLGELTDDLLNRWITRRLQEGLSRSTVKNRRGAVVALWKAAHDLELVPKGPKRIKLVKLLPPIPECWDADQTRLLLDQSDRLTGTFRQCPGLSRPKLLRAAVLVLWDTGIRPCDLLGLRSDQVTDSGKFVLRQQKTGWPQVCQMQPETVAAIRATYPPERGLVFPVNRRTLWNYFGRLIDGAGLKGSPKWVRRSSATALECEHPGAAMAHLGHKTAGLAYKHYVDPTKVQNNKPTPPGLLAPTKNLDP